MTITYVYGKNLYVNQPTAAPTHVIFCLRTTGDHVGEIPAVYGWNVNRQRRNFNGTGKTEIYLIAMAVGILWLWRAYLSVGRYQNWISAKCVKMSHIPIHYQYQRII